MAKWQRVTPVAAVAGALLVLVLVGRWLASPAPRERAPVAPKPTTATTATTRPSPIVATVRLPAAEGEIAALAFDGGSVWVADQAGGALLRVDPEANRVVSRIRMGEPQAGPWGMVAAGGGVWASFEEGTVWRIDSRTGKVTDKHRAAQEQRPRDKGRPGHQARDREDRDQGQPVHGSRGRELGLGGG